MPPKKGLAKRKAKAKGKPKAKAKESASKRRRKEDLNALPDFGEAAEEAEAESADAEPEPSEDEDDAPLAVLDLKGRVREREEEAAAEPAPKASRVASEATSKPAPKAHRVASKDFEALPGFDEASVDEDFEALPGFDEADDDDDVPRITGARLPGPGSGSASREASAADAGGDVWDQLEKELQAPLDPAAPLPVRAEHADKETAAEAEEVSDDEWGIHWEKGQDSKQTEEVLDEIQRKAAAAAKQEPGWEKSERPPKQEDDGDWESKAEWGAGEYDTGQDKKKKKETWEPDETWSEWASNSKEALAAESIVRKIRGRSVEQTDIAQFPDETAVQAFKGWVNRRLPEQRMLLAALLWLEATALEVQLVPSDLSAIALGLLSGEGKLEALDAACHAVPHHLMLRKAAAAIPSAKLRKEKSVKAIEDLKKNLSSLLEYAEFEIEEDDLGRLIDEIFIDQPTTVRVMALVHICEYLELLKKLWDDKGDLEACLAKQVSLERGVEVVCRMDLDMACSLADQTLNKDLAHIRKAKIACLNRLGVEWRLAPVEDHLMRLHMLPLERQLQALLGIERDIERKWCILLQQVSKQERSQQLREFLNFDERLRPYLQEEDILPGTKRQPLENESGKRVETTELALVRQGVSEVFKKLKARYRWKPDMSSRQEISKSNWVARLSAVLRLAQEPNCLFADKLLRKMLIEDCTRHLGTEVYSQYQTWSKLEQGDGMLIKRKKLASQEVIMRVRRQYEDYYSAMRTPGLPGAQFQPHTPAGLGVAAMTPGFGAAMTPGLAPGTPGMGAVTPGVRAPTPNWQPPGLTPVYKESEGNTPQWRPPATPLGPSAGTPLGPGTSGTPAGAPPRTPANLPPPTPNVKTDASPFTPGMPGMLAPFTPGAAPFTPGAPHTPARGSGFAGAASAAPAPMTPPNLRDAVKAET